MPLGIDFIQVLFHLFNVIILFAGLYFLLYGPVKKFMEEREEHYRQIDEEKNQALEKAEQLQAKRQAQLDGLAEELAAQRQQAGKELADLRSQRVQEAQEEARLILDKAEVEAQKKRKEIVDSAKDDITGLVADIADRLLIEGDTDSYYDAFLADAERGADHA